MVIIILGTTLSLFLFCASKEEQWRNKYYHIREELNPELKTLRKMRYQPIFITTTMLDEENTHKAVSIKYQALKVPVTNLEATMTTYQLYEANNVLWAKNLTLNQIENVIFINESEEIQNKKERIREIIETTQKTK